MTSGGCGFGAYRAAHNPPLIQATVGRWFGMTQAQVSRMERARTGPSDLRKLQRWAAALKVPADMLWFAPLSRTGESAVALDAVGLDDEHRRDLLKLTGATVVTSPGVLTDAPWQRLTDTLAGRRSAVITTV